MRVLKAQFLIGLCGLLFLVSSGSVLAASVTVSPNAVVRAGVVTASWSGFSGNVNVAVYKGSSFWVYANTNVSGTGSQGLDTTGWELRSDYRVKVELRSNPSIYQYSGYFSVSQPGVSVFPTSVVQGETVTASWSGFSGNVNVAVYKGSSFGVYASTNVSGTGSQPLNTTGWEGRSDYRVRAELRSNTAIDKYSSYFTVTIPLPDAPALYSPSDYAIRYNQTPQSFDWGSVSGADRYRIYVDNNSGFGSPEINAEPTSNQLTSYTNLSNNVYYWKIQAHNSAGWGSWSVTRRFVVDTPPPAPSLSSPANGSQFDEGTTVTFSWSGPSGYSIDRYYLRIVEGTNLDNPPKFEQELTSTSRSVTLSGWNPGTHTWGVRAIKNHPSGFNQSTYETTIGWGPYATRTFIVQTPPPSPPSGVSAVYQSSNDWNYITWNAVSGATGYKVYWGTTPGVTKSSNVLPQTSSTAYAHSGVQAGYCYYYRVSAVNSGGESELSSEVSACVPPSAPTGVSAVYQSSNDWNYITWNAVTGAESYKVYWGTSPGVTKSSNVLPETTTTDYGHSGVEAGYCYYYRVSAVNAGGESGLSSEVSACVPTAVPDIPQGVSAVQILNGIRITWNSVSGVGGPTPYQIYWGTDDSVDENNKSGVLTTDQTVYDHTGLDAGVTYYYRVKACNDLECSALSTLSSAQAPLADLTILLDPLPDDNAQRGTNIQINCAVYRTGGLLRPVDGYVRVFVYMNQDQDPNNISGQDLILGDAGDESFDFPVTEIDDGSETKPKDITIPDKDGPFYIHAHVDGPQYWAESNENNNSASSPSTIAIWRPGAPLADEPMGIVARTWDNPDVYWIKYGKKWPFLDQQTFFNLGYTDAEVEWYGSGALDGFPLGKTILQDNDNFVYRKQSSSTVYIVRNGKSDWFFNWQAFVNSGFGHEDVYWATDQGFDWIQNVYPPGELIGPQPRIRLDPNKLYFE